MSGKRFMPVPGDAVSVRPLGEGEAVVERIAPRTIALERRTRGGRAKTMAANVDTLAVVTSLAHPSPRLATLDQLLAFCELQHVNALAVFTKSDLSGPQLAERFTALYGKLGYQPLVVNPKSGENVDALRAALDGRRALLAGNSGVGKSTIFKALGGDATVGDVSRFGLGRQTTTAARLYRMRDGFLIDSPGISAFGLGSVTANELAHAFREMREPSDRCRFADCTHLSEPDCAVRAAADDGVIAESRYASYARLAEGALSQGR
jgi:ribosome biogenesis GTPase